jgi:hypothetical protein
MVVVLLQTPEANLHKSEDALQDAERMLHPGSHSAFTRFLLRCNSSTTCLYRVRREVMSWARGAALRIASPCP